MSSVSLADGRPPTIVGLLDSLSEFWAVLQDSGRFVVHIVDQAHRRLADQMAGRYPGPDARFEGLELEQTAWGPVISGLGSYAYCSLRHHTEAGYAEVVVAAVDRFFIADDASPLIHYRGDYFTLTARDR